MAAWRLAYQAFGAKPKRTRPSVEALLRRVEAGLPRIDRLTDIYNAISVRHLLPVGGEDLAMYSGPARLARAAGDEPFDTMRDGQPVTEHPEPGEVIWRDDDGVTCRCWNWRQCVRTRITYDTTSVMFILDGLAELGPGGLMTAGQELAGQLTALHPGARLSWRLMAPARRRFASPAGPGCAGMSRSSSGTAGSRPGWPPPSRKARPTSSSASPACVTRMINRRAGG